MSTITLINYDKQQTTYDITYDAFSPLLNLPPIFHLFHSYINFALKMLSLGEIVDQAVVQPDQVYNVQMRKTAYLSFIKDSILELVKGSTSTTDCSKEQAKQSKNSFYQQWLGRSSQLSCKITHVQVIPRTTLQSSYAVYCIEVKNDVAHYEIKKRYSQFQKLYSYCIRLQKIFSDFPSRTVFQTGWSEQVTNERLLKLNKILEEINSPASSQQVKIHFFQFIQLYDNYQECEVEVKKLQKQNLVTDQFLLTEMVKLNENSKSMIDSFQKIKGSISQRKRRIGYDIAKQILTGFQDYDGLLTIVMNSQNQLVIMYGLKLINWLLSPQMNRDYQIFRKILTKCIPNNLVLEQFQQLRIHCQISLEYFKLLNLYLGCRHDSDIKNIAKFYEQGESIEREYLRWSKYNSLY